jgi:bleomycin hydrolase
MSRHAGDRDVAPFVLTREWIQHAAEQVRAHLSPCDRNVRRLRQRGFEVAALDAEVLAQHHRRYSLELPTGAVRNQEQSGRCWLFAPLVLARTAALREGRIIANQSFSENYLYFFNLLEQASATLDDLRRIAASERRFSAATIRRRVLAEVMGLDDGGEWEWAFALIEKYGLVPARAMPETASSKRTKTLAVELHECFACAARAINARPERYQATRDQLIGDVIRVLVAHLGCPPRLVTARRRQMSPTAYATELVGFRPSEWRVVISNPSLEVERVYQRRASAITRHAPAFNLRRLNVSQRRFRGLVRASLEAGYAVGFSADVDRNDIDHRRGIMHPAIFNRTHVYRKQIVGDLPRQQDIYLGIASSKHAMVISGIDLRGPNNTPTKYKVVNSWGPDLGDHGVYHMYSAWFEENVFKLAVHQSVLNARERKAYHQPTPVPGGSFY